MKVWKEGRIKKKFDWRGKGAFLNRSSNAFSFNKKMWIEAEVHGQIRISHSLAECAS